ncbi:MAG: sulfotransferase family protein [Bacteroidota bacterium]
MKRQLCFLTYLARSGSTLLANELDQYESLGVTLEENLPDGIKNGRPIELKDINSLNDYLRAAYNDKKFLYWHIDEDKLKKAVLRNDRLPIRYRDILRAMHELYFAESGPEMVVHKQGNYCLLIDKVKAEFPEAKFLFIDRDPRAIHNSQRKNVRSSSLRFINRGIVRFALTYKRMQQIIRHQNRKSYFYVLHYEDLIKNKAHTLQKILRFFEINPAQKLKRQSYHSRIPEQQEHLHKNVGGSLNVDRTEAWKDELEVHRIAFLQSALKRELSTRGLEFRHGYRLSVFQKLIFIGWLIQYFFIYNLLRLTNWNYLSFRKGRFIKFGCG